MSISIRIVSTCSIYHNKIYLCTSDNKTQVRSLETNLLFFLPILSINLFLTWRFKVYDYIWKKVYTVYKKKSNKSLGIESCNML